MPPRDARSKTYSCRSDTSEFARRLNESCERAARTARALRRDPRLADQIAVWPFESAFEQDLSRPITLVEIYPSLLPMRRQDKPLDQVQVETAALRFAALDSKGQLAAILGALELMSVKQKADVLREEGWIAGIGHQALFRGG